MARPVRRPRRLTALWALAVVGIAATVLVLSPAAAHANPGDWIINRASNQCLDADANHIGPGDKVQVWSCWNGSNQHWYFDFNSCQWFAGDPYCLLHIDSNGGLCLEGGFFNGDAVTLESCDVNNTYQLWLHTPANDAWWQLAGDYLVIDLSRPCAGTNGCNVQIWKWWGGNNQRWSGPS